MLTAEAEYVLRTIEERNIRFVRLWFTDVLGFLKAFTITSQELEGALRDGMGFDGSSIEGFSRIQESDMVAVPDPSTFQIIPWKTEQPAARMFCDIYEPDGSPFDGDPRGVLKRQLQARGRARLHVLRRARARVLLLQVARRPEFLDQGGYFDETPLDVATDYRKRTVQYLEAMGIPVEYVHHEVAPSQHEIDLRYTDALTMADNVMAYRLTVKEVAQRVRRLRHLHAEAGRRRERQRHAHAPVAVRGRPQRVLRRRATSTTCRRPRRPTSPALLRHAPEITLVTNQWVNSYKRLVPGLRGAGLRVLGPAQPFRPGARPEYKPGKEEATRIEYRSPDPACNPYLAFAAMLAAGLAGISEGARAAPRGVQQHLRDERGRAGAAGIASLPEDLHDAITLAERSEVLREALGDHVHEFLIRNKRAEWDSFKSYVSPYELERYLPVL